MIQSTAIFLLDPEERQFLRTANYASYSDPQAAVRLIIARSRRSLECLADTTLIGKENIEAFAKGALRPTLDEVMLLIASALLDDKRAMLLNEYLEAARYRLMNIHGLHQGC